MLLTGNADGSPAASKKMPTTTGRTHVQDIVKGIIEGETRVIVSGMTMEEIFKEVSKPYKKAVVIRRENKLFLG